MNGDDSVDTDDIEQENGPTKNAITFSTSSLPEIKKAPEVSAMTKGCICVVYMFVSQILTIVNKFIYSTYKFKSPLNLLLLQCMCNMTICVCMMTYKSYVKYDAFENLEKYGIKIPNL